MKVITSTHYNRPTCTRKMLEHLSNCVGIEEYKIVCCVEPINDIIPNLINEFDLDIELIINDSPMGLWDNKKKAISKGFEYSDYVIHLEDDILLSDDALLYFEWAENYYTDDIFSISAYNNHPVLEDIIDRPFDVDRRNWYTPRGFAINRDRWSELDDWNGSDKELLEFKKNRFELFPLVSRCQNIGYHVGEYSEEGRIKTNIYGDEKIILNKDNWKSRATDGTYEKHYVKHFNNETGFGDFKYEKNIDL